MANKPHHRGDFPKRAKAIRDAAYANPATTCWRCGLTLQPGRKWTAGHLRDSDPTSPLAPECSRCNYSAGQALTHYRAPRSAIWDT